MATPYGVGHVTSSHYSSHDDTFGVGNHVHDNSVYGSSDDGNKPSPSDSEAAILNHFGLSPELDLAVELNTPLPRIASTADSSDASRNYLQGIESLVLWEVSRPRLPYDILLDIVDIIALDYDRDSRSDETHWDYWDSRVMLRACSLMNKLLAAHVQVQRYLCRNTQKLVLRSSQDVSNQAVALRRSRSLARTICILKIDATTSQSQSWVSTVPLSLPISKMSNLLQLQLHGVDFTQLHPNFSMFFARLKHPGPLRTLHLVNIRYTRYSQLTRLFCATGCATAHVNGRFVDDDDIPRMATPPLHPGRLMIPRGVRHLTWNMSWDMLERLADDISWEDSSDCQLDIQVHAHLDDLPLGALGDVLEQAVRMSRRLKLAEYNLRLCTISLWSDEPFSGERFSDNSSRYVSADAYQY